MADYNRYGHTYSYGGGGGGGGGYGQGPPPSAPPAPHMPATTSAAPPSSSYGGYPPATYPPPPAQAALGGFGYGSGSAGYGYGYGSGFVPVAFPPGTHPDVERAFRAADRDGSGAIDERELQGALSDAYHRFSIRTVRLLMFLFDDPASASSAPSRMGPTQFVSLWNCLGQWRGIFDRYDRDRSGKIDSRELTEALRSLGYAVPPSVIELLIANYNNGVPSNGALDFDNFVDYEQEGEELNKKVRSMLMAIIEGRLAENDTNGYGNDLLGLMLEARALEKEGHQMLTTQEIVDECKTFFFAGQDTTSHLLTWTMFLLSTYPEWQHKLREEVLRECGNAVPNPDMVTKLKLVNMVLLESLRLYSPVVSIKRGTGSDIQLGNIRVPKGTMLSIPIALLHRDKDVWGHDADEFNPARFEHGVSKAAPNHPNALLSFSQGPRACIGQNFAMLEARIGIAMILQRFSFELSPKYVHAPKEAITLIPRFGLPMILRNLQD